MKNEIYLPFFEKFKAKHPEECSKYNMLNDYLTLIFPRDKSVILSVIAFTNSSDKTFLRYFVVFPEKPEELFEWTYFQSEQIEIPTYYGKEVVQKINSISEWNYTYRTLDDKNLWDNHVLKKEGGNYKYLKKME